MTKSTAKVVSKQIKLPLSRAVEIAWKQIRMRLSRSMLVTSGIVLAIAFLLAIRVGDIVADGMRSWIARSTASAEFDAKRAEQVALASAVRELRTSVRNLAQAAPLRAPGPLDLRAVAGVPGLAELAQELGSLPADVVAMENALAVSTYTTFRASFEAWLSAERRLKVLRDTLAAPQELAAILADQGVPTAADDIAASRLQQRWLLGLALLVAFVGILNAMLMSVAERFREIGTMKCLGALDGFIVKLFLIESLFQGVVGTILGVVVGLAASLLIAWLTFGHFAFLNLPWDQILISAALSGVIGVVLTVAGALLPAYQAARMHPIAAMRADV